MNGLTIDPLSDPETIRQEASGTAAQSIPQETSSNQQVFPPVLEQQKAELDEAAQPTSPLPTTVASVYPTPVDTSQKTGTQVPNTSSASDTSYESMFSYPVPAGIYVIASWGFAYSLIQAYMSASVLFNGVRMGIDIEGTAVAIIVFLLSYGLIRAQKLAYWGLLVGASLYLMFSLYALVRAFSLSRATNFFDTTFIGWMYATAFASIIITIGIIIYLTRPKVAGAFS